MVIKVVYILDTSAIFSGMNLMIKGSEILTTLSVSDEIKPGGKDYQKFELLKEIGLKIISPSKKSINIIKENAKKTGDLERLSETDIDILGLAIDLIEEKKEPIIITDDYSIQNLADELKISYQNIIQKRITKKIIWITKCLGCGKKFKEHINICPICGSKTKKKVLDKKDTIM